MPENSMTVVTLSTLLCLAVSVFVILLSTSLYYASPADPRRVPQDFKLGVASSAYQIEGAWNLEGKGENIWDHLSHHRPEHIGDRSNGDIACDSYHKYKEDVQMLKQLGVDFYRFSLSWSRILPSGFVNHINWKGVQYYNNLIEELLKYGIQPMVTIYHWDLPQPLQEIGGWPNPLLEDHYAEYARLCFRLFGDRVKLWTTFNEPRLICWSSYGDGVMAPAYKSSGVGDYLCGHTLLKAHARAYHIYNEEFREAQQGKVSLVLEFQWIEPKTNSTTDENVAELTRHFLFGWFAHPIYYGDYPKQMIELVAERSKKQGFVKSRLPKFTAEEVDYIKGTVDFLGLNSYTTFLVTPKEHYNYELVSWEQDINVEFSYDPTWEDTAMPLFKFLPQHIRRVLQWIKKTYNNPEIMITEMGYAGNDTVDDLKRIQYYQKSISAVMEALYLDEVNVKGYTAWTLMDNYEWVDGYKIKMGLYHVDFNSANRTRTPKKSVEFFSNLTATRCLVENCDD